MAVGSDATVAAAVAVAGLVLFFVCDSLDSVKLMFPSYIVALSARRSVVASTGSTAMRAAARRDDDVAAAEGDVVRVGEY